MICVYLNEHIIYFLNDFQSHDFLVHDCHFLYLGNRHSLDLSVLRLLRLHYQIFVLSWACWRTLTDRPRLLTGGRRQLQVDYFHDCRHYRVHSLCSMLQLESRVRRGTQQWLLLKVQILWFP